MFLAIAELFGIATSSQVGQPDALTLLSCASCHD
jgi:hypothetical protein